MENILLGIIRGPWESREGRGELGRRIKGRKKGRPLIFFNF